MLNVLRFRAVHGTLKTGKKPPPHVQDERFDECETAEEFGRELHHLYRELAEASDDERAEPPAFDPLADDLSDIRPDDESRPEWLEIRTDFDRAERTIEDARSLLPTLNPPRRFRGGITTFPARIHQTARALLFRTGAVWEHGPRGRGHTWANAARIILQERDKASDAEILACLAIATSREAAEMLAKLDTGKPRPRNNAALADWKSRHETALAVLRDAETFVELAETERTAEAERRRAEAEKARADELEQDPARITGQKQRKGAKVGGDVWKERAAEWHPHAERLATESWKANRARSANAIAPDIVPLIPKCKDGWRPGKSAVRQFIAPIITSLKKADTG
jgi:hypothetical protein